MIDQDRQRDPLGESVVDEVRAIREALDEEAGHDVTKLAEMARRASDQVRREFGFKSAQLPIPSRRHGA